MRTKRVLRYYCDFCKKAGCSKFHMESHEKHCTMNPNRSCRMCENAEIDSKPLDVLMALLPNPKDFERTERVEIGFFGDGNYSDLLVYTGLEKVVAEVMDKLWDAAGSCPACVLAALRQKGLTAHIGDDTFNYKKSVKEFWDETNSGRNQHEEYC
jgi:hypothetical protein